MRLPLIPVLLAGLVWRLVAGGWWAGRGWYHCRATVLAAVALLADGTDSPGAASRP